MTNPMTPEPNDKGRRQILEYLSDIEVGFDDAQHVMRCIDALLTEARIDAVITFSSSIYQHDPLAPVYIQELRDERIAELKKEASK